MIGAYSLKSSSFSCHFVLDALFVRLSDIHWGDFRCPPRVSAHFFGLQQPTTANEAPSRRSLLPMEEQVNFVVADCPREDELYYGSKANRHL